ncbi:hypothetical protein [Pedobacter sp. L105]|uniref:hypothetical protein n=1 Tax=Pedobacter sp. L105 TaxID=1641871 RepID=UPI00131CB13E|nr:hypothetical protein [Pedobacter sp. L105]
MIDRLYQQYAGYYAGVTSDRSYKDHLDYIINSFSPEQPCQSFLELFAGQALHSIEALKRKDIDVWAIDSSAEMKQLALEGGFEKPDQYLVGLLPDAILAFAGKVKFDCILSSSCSISYLNKKEVYQLLQNSKELLHKNGKVFIEMYDIISFMEGSHFSAYGYSWFPKVQNTAGEIIRLMWPSGKIKWDQNSYSVSIPVKLMVESSKGTDVTEFISEQHIHSAEDIIFIADLLGYTNKVLSNDIELKNSFDNGVVIELTYE